MFTLFEFSKTISTLNKEEKYLESLLYFKSVKSSFTTEQIGNNNYIICDVLKALRKTNNFKNAFKFLDIYAVNISEGINDRILINYAWLLYSKFKAENNSNNEIVEEHFDDELIDNSDYSTASKSETIERIEVCIKLLRDKSSKQAYTVLSNLFNLVVKIEKRKASVNWRFINEFCDLVNPEHLSPECDTIEVERKGVKKSMELASAKENWYANKTKALIKLGLHKECFELSMAAVNTFDKFHYSNDVWLARRIALSKKALGNVEEAIAELQQVAERKKDWFILKELAELYKEVGETQKAFTYAIQAITSFGELEYKVDLLFLLGELLLELQEEDLAHNHFLLAKLIRINENWSIPQKLSLVLTQFENNQPPLNDLKSLKKELKRYWDTSKEQLCKPKLNKIVKSKILGRITKILNDNKNRVDGFITGENKLSYYFRVDRSDKITDNMKLGNKVSFGVLLSKDNKKHRAIDLILV